MSAVCPACTRSGGLTERQVAVVKALIKTGGSNKHIARDLGISDGTVKLHMTGIMKKIGASNRVQVLMWAAENIQEAV